VNALVHGHCRWDAGSRHRATSAIFTVVEAVILRLLYAAPAAVRITPTSISSASGRRTVGVGAVRLPRTVGRVRRVAAIWPITANLTGITRPEGLETILADTNYFELLGARPEIGRLFGPQDYQTGISPVVVISDGLWRRGFGGDPNVLGRTLRIDNDAYQVIGVVSKDFRHPSLTLETDAEVWALAVGRRRRSLRPGTACGSCQARSDG
jgi:hypothetical protein